MCLDYPQTWFYGEEEREGLERHRPTMTKPEVRRAKAICARCPVLWECYEFAMANPEAEYGVWGGTTRRERLRYTKYRMRATEFDTQILAS